MKLIDALPYLFLFVISIILHISSIIFRTLLHRNLYINNILADFISKIICYSVIAWLFYYEWPFFTGMTTWMNNYLLLLFLFLTACIFISIFTMWFRDIFHMSSKVSDILGRTVFMWIIALLTIYYN